MIITRTPFRISFFGGGTDFPEFYNQYGGSVLSSTINKYCYIVIRVLPPYFDYKYRIRYTKREEVNCIDDIIHPVVRESLKFMEIKHGIEVVHTSDIPAMSGIGSSSSFTVGFLHSLYAMQGKIVSKRVLAGEAIKIEQEILRENVGSQDQAAAAFGGFNRIDFNKEKKFYVTPITIKEERIEQIQHSLMLYFTGFTRNSSDISLEQRQNIKSNIRELTVMKDLVDEAISILNSQTEPIDSFGRLLDETWKIKRNLSTKVSNEYIDDIYSIAKKSGAIGGKLLGAGGGGFLLCFVPREKQAAVRLALKDLLYVPFRFEKLGSQIIMYTPEDYYE
jgi:D-glycero-alpha-D-manno-heptose-7-phosphate kinase